MSPRSACSSCLARFLVRAPRPHRIAVLALAGFLAAGAAVLAEPVRARGAEDSVEEEAPSLAG